jgi:hypothetical protein
MASFVLRFVTGAAITAVAVVLIPATASAAGAKEIAVFDNSSYVDTAGNTASESDMLQATLSDLGHNVTTFTDYSEAGLTAALADKDILVFPELEVRPLASVLSAGAVGAIQDYVDGGGGLIVFGSNHFGIRNGPLLSLLLDRSLTEHITSGTSTLQTANATGTPFAGGPSSLPWAETTSALTGLDAGEAVYSNGDGATVAKFTRGAGHAAYIGWDWYEGAPAGSQDLPEWKTVLSSAVAYAGEPVKPRVGVLAYCTDMTGIYGAENAVNALVADGRFASVTAQDADQNPPTAQQLSDDFDVVLGITDSRCGGTSPSQPLVDYAAAGGSVVLGTFGYSSPLDVGFGIGFDAPIFGPGLSPFQPVSVSNGDYALGVDLANASSTPPCDDMFDNVTGPVVSTFSNFVTLSPGATLCGSYTNGEEFLAINEDGNICGLNTFLADADSYTQADYGHLIANVVFVCSRFSEVASDTDADDDGVTDADDNCVNTANADQANNDGDSLGDVCDPDDDNDTVNDTDDNCPVNANADQANNDGDSLGDVCDPDDDNDTVNDTDDNCPVNANADQANDNDGVTDAHPDNCQFVANPGQADGNNNGVGSACEDDIEPDTQITSAAIGSTNANAATFTYTGTDDESDPAHLAFQCKRDSGSFGTCSFPLSSLSPGSHTFYVRATDEAGNTDSTPASETWWIRYTTSLLYNGGQVVNVGTALPLSANLSSAYSPGCVSGKPIGFSIDDDPATTTIESPWTALGAPANTNSSGLATKAIATTGWNEGVYTLRALFAQDSQCQASQDTATLTAAMPGEAANGGGWYTLSGVGRSNFGFTVRKTSSTPLTYKGQFLLINNGKWRLKGVLSSYSKLSNSPSGAASGTGTLFKWDQTLNGGLGDWTSVKSGVTFTTKFTDGGSGKKAAPDLFGVRIDYKPAAGEPPLPNADPIAIKGGDVKVN